MAAAPEMVRLEVVEEVVVIPVGQIDDSDRLRPLDAAWVEALTALIGRDGQRTPVEVYPQATGLPFRLGPGGHRLAAVRALGLPGVKAIIKDGDALARREAEISENLFRSDLKAMERATFVAELVQIERAKAGVEGATAQKIAADARWAKAARIEADNASDIMSRAYGFADDVSARLGLSSKTIYRDLFLFRGLGAEAQTLIAERHPDAPAAALKKLTTYPHGQQATIARSAEPGDLAGFLRRMTAKPQPTAEDRRLNAFLGAFQRMGVRERRAALQALEAMGLPKGFALTGGEA